MKPDKIAVIAFALATGACGLVWYFLPSLQAAQRRADAEASLHLERARRLLHQYSSNVAYQGLLLDQLREVDVDVDISDPAALVENAGDDYQERHADLWMAFEPRDWDQDPPRAVKPSYGNVAGQIRDGIKGRAVLVAENGKLLKDALEEIEKSDSATSGGASASTHFEAMRLKGVVQYHRGLAERLRANLKRAEADGYRRRLVELANQGVAWDTSKTLVGDSGIEDQIRGVKEQAAQAEAELNGDRKALAALDATISDLEKSLNAAQSRADQARAAMEKLEREGVDFSDPRGAEIFAERLTAQDSAYREALREVQSLEAGRLPKADIDASGDFLKGRYLENGSAANLTVEHGLAHYRNERIVLGARVEGEQTGLADALSDLSRLEGMRAASLAAQTDATNRIAEAGPLAAEAYEQLNRVESEAQAIEDAALKMLDQSVSASQQAAGAVEEWMSQARDRTQSLSPEAADFSAFKARENDDWIGGHIAVQSADARLAKAWIYYDRFVSASQNADILSLLTQTFGFREADPENERTKAEAARQAGIDEITKAMDVLTKAHPKTEKHWTVVAQAAGTTYLLALFGQNDYLSDAIEGYRNALKGREAEKFTEVLETRLKRLESR